MIRDGVGKLDPAFGYADRYDQAGDTYSDLVWAKGLPEQLPDTAVLVRASIVLDRLKDEPSTEPKGRRPDSDHRIL